MLFIPVIRLVWTIYRKQQSNDIVVTQQMAREVEMTQYGIISILGRGLECIHDGLTYTYKLRKDKWYTADGEEYAPVTPRAQGNRLKYAG